MIIDIIVITLLSIDLSIGLFFGIKGTRQPQKPEPTGADLAGFVSASLHDMHEHCRREGSSSMHLHDIESLLKRRAKRN